MPRVRKGAARAQARKRILRKARGYFGTKSRHKYQAVNAVIFWTSVLPGEAAPASAGFFGTRLLPGMETRKAP